MSGQSALDRMDPFTGHHLCHNKFLNVLVGTLNIAGPSYSYMSSSRNVKLEARNSDNHSY